MFGKKILHLNKAIIFPHLSKKSKIITFINDIVETYLHNQNLLSSSIPNLAKVDIKKFYFPYGIWDPLDFIVYRIDCIVKNNLD